MSRVPLQENVCTCKKKKTFCTPKFIRLQALFQNISPSPRYTYTNALSTSPTSAQNHLVRDYWRMFALPSGALRQCRNVFLGAHISGRETARNSRAPSQAVRGIFHNLYLLLLPQKLHSHFRNVGFGVVLVQNELPFLFGSLTADVINECLDWDSARL